MWSAPQILLAQLLVSHLTMVPWLTDNLGIPSASMGTLT